MGREDEVRLIAYSIWEEESCPDGHDCEHWFRAEALWEERQKGKDTGGSVKAKPRQVVKQQRDASGKRKSPKKS